MDRRTVAFTCTVDCRYGVTEAEPLLNVVDPEAFMADKAYDVDLFLERFFARRKQFRGVATRYDKLKSTFFVAGQLVSAIIGMS